MPCAEALPLSCLKLTQGAFAQRFISLAWSKAPGRPASHTEERHDSRRQCSSAGVDHNDVPRNAWGNQRLSSNGSVAHRSECIGRQYGYTQSGFDERDGGCNLCHFVSGLQGHLARFESNFDKQSNSACACERNEWLALELPPLDTIGIGKPAAELAKQHQLVAHERNPIDALFAQLKCSNTAVNFAGTDHLQNLVRTHVVNLYGNAGVFASEFCNGVRQDNRSQQRGRGNFHASPLSVSKLVDVIDGVLQFIENLVRRLAKLPADIRQFNAARGSVKETKTEFGLEILYRLRERGLRDVHLSRSRGEAARFGDGQETFDLFDCNAHANIYRNFLSIHTIILDCHIYQADVFFAEDGRKSQGKSS